MRFASILVTSIFLLSGFAAELEAQSPTSGDVAGEPAPNSSRDERAEPEKKPASSADAGSKKKEQSPYDYQSSEEISEDRSVSFPVDI